MIQSPTLHRLVTAAGALALVAAATPAHAVSVKDDLVSVGIRGQLQVRANLLNDVTNAVGNDVEYDSVVFAARRARFGLAAKMGDFRGNLVFRAAENAGITAPGGGDAVTLYYANVYYGSKLGDGFEHELGIGLDKPFTGESAISSNSYLLPTERVTAENASVRGYGLFYKLTGPMFAIGAGLLNGENAVVAAGPTAGAAVNDGQDNFTYTIRAEIAPGAQFWTAKRQESWAGAEGTQLVLGAEYVNNLGNQGNADATDAANEGDTFWFGVDLTFHWNNLTAMIDYRQITNEGASTGPVVPADVDTQAWAIQAGWAFKLDSGYVVEPAVRFAMLDANTDNDNETPNYAGENGGSGTIIDIGANWYWKGHNNKTQLALQLWSAEDGDADATIVRLQQQFSY